MSWLKLLLSEDNGSPSTMRLVVALVVLCQVAVWAFVSIRQVALQPLSIEQVVALLGPLGFKALQKGKEKPDGKEGEG